MSITASPSTDVAARIRKALEEAGAPVTLKALAKRTRLPADELNRILAAEVQRRVIHRWPNYRGQQRFWNRAPEEVTREQILQAASERAVAVTVLAAQIRKRMPGYPAKLIGLQIQQLLRDKELRKYPSFGREKEIIGREGHPGAYAAAAQLAIHAILDKLSAAGIAAGPLPVLPPQPEPAATVPLEQSLLQAMELLEPSRTAPVSVKELRAALPSVQKPAFDQAALHLRSQQRVFLSRHDFPQSLSPEDRDALIDGQDGSYYVAITSRSE